MQKAILLFLCLFTLALLGQEAEIISPNRAFWAERIEIRGNENLYFQPRVPYFPTKPGDTYELQITVPSFLEYDAETVESLLPLTEGGGFTIVNKELRIEKNAKGDNVITIIPELEQLFGYEIGRTVPRPLKVTFEVRGTKVPAGTFLTCENVPIRAERNAYSQLSSGIVQNGRIVREIKVTELPAGDYEWQKVEAVCDFPILCSGIILRFRGAGSGVIDVRNFQLENAKGGKYCAYPNFTKKAEMPAIAPLPQYLEEGGIRCDFSAKPAFVIPFGKHTSMFHGEHLREVCFTPLLAFKQLSQGTGKLTWTIKVNGNLMQRGRMSLEREAAPTATPDMEIGIWVAESQFEDLAADGKRNAYNFIKGLGINTVYLHFGEPTEFKEKFTPADVRMESADIAKEMGFQMRFYPHVFYRHHGHTRQPFHWVRDKYPESMETDFRGRKDHLAGVVCESWLLDGPADKPGVSPYLDNLKRAITELIKLYNAKGIFWDYERSAIPTHLRKYQRPAASYQPWMPAPCCCQRCRQSFATQYHLKSVPTIEEILAEKNLLFDQWIDFQCRRSRRIWLHIRAAAQAGNPNAGLALYSGTPGDISREIYRVDWDLAGDAIDQAVTLHNWYAGDKAFDSYREALAKTAPRGVTVEVNAAQTLCGYGTWEQRGAWRWIQQIKTNLMRRTFHLGADIYNICGLWGMDSQWNTSVRQANALLAKYRDFVRAAKRVENPAVNHDLPPGAYMDTFSDGKRSITFIYNPGASQSDIKLTLPGFAEQNVKILPYDVIPVEFSPKP